MNLIIILLIIVCTVAAPLSPGHATQMSSPKSNVNKHIVILCLSPGKGGVKTHCMGLYRLLDQLNLNPLLIMQYDDQVAQAFEKKSAARIIFYKLPKPTKNLLSTSACTGTLLYKTNHFMCFLKNICTTYNVQLIHANYPWDLPPLKILKQQLPIKIIYTLHSDAPAYQKNLSICDSVICLSSITLKKLVAEGNVKNIPFYEGEPVFNEQPYISFIASQEKQEFFKQQFNIDIQNRTVCTIISNFYACKNQAVAIKAFATLINKYKTPACLILAGYGACQQACMKLARKLSLLHKDVYFLGYINDPIRLAYHSDIIVNTSTRDAFPITLLEASMLKKPIIATFDTGANRIIINNKTGLLFHHDNPGELADCIQTYINHPSLRSRLAEECHKHALHNFSYQHNIKKLLHIYLEMHVLSKDHPLFMEKNNEYKKI